MKRQRTFLIESDKKISLVVYIAGHKNSGEGSVVLLKKQNDVLFSVAIDSFICNGGTNAIYNILQEENIQRLDLVCWTHPHADHSMGIDKLINMCNSESGILIPNISTHIWYREKLLKLFTNHKMRDDQQSKTMKYFCEVQKMNRYGKKNNGKLIHATSGTSVLQSVIEIGDKRFPFTIECLSPCGNIVENNKLSRYSGFNDYSISLLISFGNWQLFFAGDIENNTIRQIIEDGYMIDDLCLLKVPHHGAISSNEVCSIIRGYSKEAASVITNFTKQNLPCKSVIDMYQKLKFKNVFLYGKTDELDFGILRNTITLDRLGLATIKNETSGICYNIK